MPYGDFKDLARRTASDIKEVNDKDPKFKVGDHVRISNTVWWTYIINDLNGEEIIEIFYEKELKKNQQVFRTEKVIKRKENKLCVKWKGYDNSLNSWIDKKNLIEWNSLV